MVDNLQPDELNTAYYRAMTMLRGSVMVALSQPIENYVTTLEKLVATSVARNIDLCAQLKQVEILMREEHNETANHQNSNSTRS